MPLNFSTGRSLLYRPPVVAAAGISMFAGTAAVASNGYSGGDKTYLANGGTNLPACLFVFGFATDDGASLTKCQIGATNMSPVSSDGSPGKMQMFAAVYAGGSDTITLGNGNTYDKIGYASGWATGGSLIATAVSPQKGTYAVARASSSNHFYLGTDDAGGAATPCVVPANGVGFVFAGGVFNAAANNSPSWANVDGSPAPSNGFTTNVSRVGLAVKATSGSWSPEFWGSGAGYDYACGMVACGFGP